MDTMSSDGMPDLHDEYCKERRGETATVHEMAEKRTAKRTASKKTTGKKTAANKATVKKAAGRKPRSPGGGGRSAPTARTYWENRGPRDWRPVTVRIRYGDLSGEPVPALPHVRLKRKAPMNVLVERDDGSRVVKPIRQLRVHSPK
ncbi:hypothetical protein ACFU5O_33785 [Streptomyces sp. NPDC057445]|uniref:hypothetical protein n=1 Tax=Streptomyces sp. NPDC057445 TaxID=3346136 RepID=UPI0036A7B736